MGTLFSYPRHPQVGDKFSYVIVKDIAEPGAFDEAVKGVDTVAHTASPFHVCTLSS